MDARGEQEHGAWLSEEEILRLGVAVAGGMDVFTEEEWEGAMERAHRWACYVRIRQCYLELTLAGKLSMRIEPNGEPGFSAIGAPTERGAEAE